MLLPVTFENRENFCTEHITFDIMPINLLYNDILGFHALAKFMAAVHHAYNVVKLPGSTGIITIHNDEKDAISLLTDARRIAASAESTTRDKVELAALPPSRKQPMFSQTWAETKKIPLNDDSSGPTFTIGTGLTPEREGVLVAFLRKNRDMFAWPMADMTGVPSEVIDMTGVPQREACEAEGAPPIP